MCTVMHISLGRNEPLAWKLTTTHTPSLGHQGLTWKSSKWQENTRGSRKDQMGKRNGPDDKDGIRSFCSQRSVFCSSHPAVCNYTPVCISEEHMYPLWFQKVQELPISICQHPTHNEHSHAFTEWVNRMATWAPGLFLPSSRDPQPNNQLSFLHQSQH